MIRVEAGHLLLRGAGEVSPWPMESQTICLCFYSKILKLHTFNLTHGMLKGEKFFSGGKYSLVKANKTGDFLRRTNVSGVCNRCSGI